jgi:hypothetical protein
MGIVKMGTARGGAIKNNFTGIPQFGQLIHTGSHENLPAIFFSSVLLTRPEVIGFRLGFNVCVCVFVFEE